MVSVSSGNWDRYMHTVGVFAAVCVMCDSLVSCLTQLSDGKQQSAIFFGMMTLCHFFMGFMHAKQKKAADGTAKVVPAKKFVRTGSIANEGEFEARQAVKRSIHAKGTPPMAPPTDERGAGRDAHTAEPQIEPPQMPLRVPRYRSRSSTGAQASKESEDTVNMPFDGNKTEPSVTDARVMKQARREGVELSASDATISHNDATCDIEELTSAVEEPVILHTGTERTPLRREASSFVPNSCEAPWQMPSETSMLCNWVPYAPSQYDKLLQMRMQQMGSQCDEWGNTVTLRHLPCPFMREELIREMDAKGFAGLYDFVYVPVDFDTQVGLGFGFVNLVSAEELPRFVLAFDGFQDWPLPSSKICSVEVARTQGLDANISRFRDSPVMGDEVPEWFKPVIFRGTERVPFPEPTKQLPSRVLRTPSL